MEELCDGVVKMIDNFPMKDNPSPPAGPRQWRGVMKGMMCNPKRKVYPATNTTKAFLLKWRPRTRILQASYWIKWTLQKHVSIQPRAFDSSQNNAHLLIHRPAATMANMTKTT
mmetsp:Transcript_40302/g.72607  ORF Transcript_40302/g.72607 Transcript_40302/m.72607 type:complete len:113 (+) Transcript_40302:2357-2695(+)